MAAPDLPDVRRPTLTDDGCPLGYDKIGGDEDFSECQLLGAAHPWAIAGEQDGMPPLMVMLFGADGRLQELRFYGERFIITHKVFGADRDYIEHTWNDDGVLTVEAEVRDGDGVRAATFHESGHKASEGPLDPASQQLVGTWVFWDEDGRELREETFSLD